MWPLHKKKKKKRKKHKILLLLWCHQPAVVVDRHLSSNYNTVLHNLSMVVLLLVLVV